MSNISFNLNNADELRDLIRGTMSNSFHRETFENELTKEYLDSQIRFQKNLIHGAQKTLLIKRVMGNNIFITMFFLDSADKPIFTSDNVPSGLEIKTPSIDNEILNLFGDKDSVIIT